MKLEDKKKLAELRAMAQQREEEERIRFLNQQVNEETPISIEDEGEEDEKKFSVISLENEHWKKILANYINKFPEQELSNNHRLSFPSREAAEEFFADQATQGLEFLVSQIENEKLLDNHMFSCGDTHLYRGSYAEIQQQLKEALKNETSPEIQAKISTGIEFITKQMALQQNPTFEMKSRLQESKNVGTTEKDTMESPSPLK